MKCNLNVSLATYRWVRIWYNYPQTSIQRKNETSMANGHSTDMYNLSEFHERRYRWSKMQFRSKR